MHQFQEGNQLVLQTELVSVTLDGDMEDGISICANVPSLFLSMVSLCKKEELTPFLTYESGKFRLNIKNSIKTDAIGTKKAIQTSFADNVNVAYGEPLCLLILDSEDTHLPVYLSKTDWEALIIYFQLVVNGYDRMK